MVFGLLDCVVGAVLIWFGVFSGEAPVYWITFGILRILGGLTGGVGAYLRQTKVMRIYFVLGILNLALLGVLINLASDYYPCSRSTLPRVVFTKNMKNHIANECWTYRMRSKCQLECKDHFSVGIPREADSFSDPKEAGSFAVFRPVRRGWAESQLQCQSGYWHWVDFRGRLHNRTGLFPRCVPSKELDAAVAEEEAPRSLLEVRGGRARHSWKSRRAKTDHRRAADVSQALRAHSEMMPTTAAAAMGHIGNNSSARRIRVARARSHAAASSLRRRGAAVTNVGSPDQTPESNSDEVTKAGSPDQKPESDSDAAVPPSEDEETEKEEDKDFAGEDEDVGTEKTLVLGGATETAKDMGKEGNKGSPRRQKMKRLARLAWDGSGQPTREKWTSWKTMMIGSLIFVLLSSIYCQVITFRFVSRSCCDVAELDGMEDYSVLLESDITSEGFLQRRESEGQWSVRFTDTGAR